MHKQYSKGDEERMKKIIAAMLAVMLIMTAFSGVSWAKETVSPAPSASSAGGNGYADIGAGPSELLGKTELPVDSEAPVLNGWQNCQAIRTCRAFR